MTTPSIRTPAPDPRKERRISELTTLLAEARAAFASIIEWHDDPITSDAIKILMAKNAAQAMIMKIDA